MLKMAAVGKSGSGSGSLVGRAPELRHHTDGVHDYGAAKEF